ncbi:glycosyltransferase family 4 protein [Patescibacteria group bacterium]|nr:glycosyltransferase family 4 protein [Patescibacteria group bacterium]MBU1673545.1 glycosyltransferase family 4 protein [Patescibacteria group bacterium]MBU1963623.1 glycosyltransferase family 4 protein [Patescibacteria group bacterium]
MKILITNTGPWGTGSATVVNGVLDELLKRGHEVRVVFPDSGFPSPELDKYYKKEDIFKIIKFPVTYKGTEFYTFPLIITDPHPRNYRDAWTFKDMSEEKFLLYMEFLKENIKQAIDEFEPDVIECQHIWAMDHIIKDLGHDYISVAHHSDQMGFLYDKRMRKYAKEGARKSKFIFAISEMVKEEVLDLYPVNSDKVIVLSNGYDQKTFFPETTSIKQLNKEHNLNLSEEAPLVTFAGKISKTKGVDVLLKANKLIQKEKEVSILLFGGGAFSDIVKKEEMHEYEMKNVVHMGHNPGHVLAKFHNAADLSVMPSRSEGFGIAALEAMACNTPIVTTETGGPDTFIIGGTVPKEDPEALAQEILKYVNKPKKEIANLGREAYEKAQEFTWENIVDGRMNYYEKMAK